MDMVGSWTNPSEKYEFVNWDDENSNMWENEKKTKTPTSDGCVQPEPQSLLTVVMLVWLVVYLPEKHAWAHTVGWEYYEKICEE